MCKSEDEDRSQLCGPFDFGETRREVTHDTVTDEHRKERLCAIIAPLQPMSEQLWMLGAGFPAIRRGSLARDCVVASSLQFELVGSDTWGSTGHLVRQGRHTTMFPWRSVTGVMNYCCVSSVGVKRREPEAGFVHLWKIYRRDDVTGFRFPVDVSSSLYVRPDGIDCGCTVGLQQFSSTLQVAS